MRATRAARLFFLIHRIRSLFSGVVIAVAVVLASKQQTRREKPIQQKQKAGIVTSLNDTTLTKVTYGKYATRVPDEVAYGIYDWCSSQ